MPGRQLADVDALLLDILIPIAGEGHVGENRPADYLDRLPFVHAYRWGGTAVHAEFLDQATVDVHVYAEGKTAALGLAEACRTALYEAWQFQTIYPHGSISRWEEQAAPVPLRNPIQPDRVTTVAATSRLWVCPPPTNS